MVYDHLGNTRVSYTPDGWDAVNLVCTFNVSYAADYSPYGKIVREYKSGETTKYITTQHERDGETGLDYRGARYYDCDVARFLSLDPMANKYPALSAYCYVGGNPIIFIDEDGKEIRLTFASPEARDSYVAEVNKALGGSCTISFVEVNDDLGYTNQVVLTDNCATNLNMTDEQKAFVDAYSKAVGDEAVARQAVVYNKFEVENGNWKFGEFDIGDAQQFDKAGQGGASTAGAIIHETVEQIAKAKLGILPGKSGDSNNKIFQKEHNKANKVEGKVNGNKRLSFLDKHKKGHQYFLEKNLKVTDQSIFKDGSNGSTKVKKRGVFQ